MKIRRIRILWLWNMWLGNLIDMCMVVFCCVDVGTLYGMLRTNQTRARCVTLCKGGTLYGIPRYKPTRAYTVTLCKSGVLWTPALQRVALWYVNLKKKWTWFWQLWTFTREFSKMMDVVLKIVDFYVWIFQNNGPDFENCGLLRVNFSK